MRITHLALFAFIFLKVTLSFSYIPSFRASILIPPDQQNFSDSTVGEWYIDKKYDLDSLNMFLSASNIKTITIIDTNDNVIKTSYLKIINDSIYYRYVKSSKLTLYKIKFLGIKYKMFDGTKELCKGLLYAGAFGAGFGVLLNLLNKEDIRKGPTIGIGIGLPLLVLFAEKTEILDMYGFDETIIINYKAVQKDCDKRINEYKRKGLEYPFKRK